MVKASIYFEEGNKGRNEKNRDCADIAIDVWETRISLGASLNKCTNKDRESVRQSFHLPPRSTIYYACSYDQ